MDSEFSYTDLLLVRMNVQTKSAADIALIVGRNNSDVQELINRISRDSKIKSYDEAEREKLDKKSAKSSAKKINCAKSDQEHISSISIKKKKKATALEEINKKRFEAQDKVIVKRKGTRDVYSQEKSRRRVSESKFSFVQRDYSKMISVRIDRRTVILVKPGTDIEKAKESYFKNKSN